MSDDQQRMPDDYPPAPPPLPATAPTAAAPVVPHQPQQQPYPVQYAPQYPAAQQYGTQQYAPGTHYSPQPQFNIVQQNLVVAPEPKGLSVASFVLALLSILLGFTFIVPVVALILGIVGARKEPAGRGWAITGIVLSSLILLTWVLVALFAFGVLASLLSFSTVTVN